MNTTPTIWSYRTACEQADGMIWNPDGLGNHRAIVNITLPAPAVRLSIPWRRRDREPDQVAVRVFYFNEGEEIRNVLPLHISRERGEFVFEAARAGMYAFYYLPYHVKGWICMPNVEYLPAAFDPAPAWLSEIGASGGTITDQILQTLPEAPPGHIECRLPFDSFYPMEVPATTAEMETLNAVHSAAPFLVFPEDRMYPIRMRDEIPYRWIRRGPGGAFRGCARPNEYYVFQIGIFALCNLENLTIVSTGLRTPDGAEIPAEALTCFNLRGRDWLGRRIEKEINLSSGAVQALWIGVDVPADSVPGIYDGTIRIGAKGLTSMAVPVSIRVQGDPLTDRGDSELWRHSRLRWLDSVIGLDDEVAAAYEPVRRKGDTIYCLGRVLRVGPDGLPSAIESFFTPEGDRVGPMPTAILAAPVCFNVQTSDSGIKWTHDPMKWHQPGAGALCWTVESLAETLEMRTEARMECEGHIEYRIHLLARRETTLRDIALEITWSQGASAYMLGMGYKGGTRPDRWEYKWDINRANHQFWLGSPHAGLQVKLKHDQDVWEICNLKAAGLPALWHNEGRGGCTLTAGSAGEVRFRAFCGNRVIQAGETITFRFSLLITPFKPLDMNARWHRRCYHTAGTPDLDEVVGTGANLLNVHQGNRILPHINYPFKPADIIREFMGKAQSLNLAVRIYYTVRELSNYADEFWALRSLGHEIFRDGRGFHLADHFESSQPWKNGFTGGPWLCEHVRDDFTPAWHQPFWDGGIDAALPQAGLSRWHNYYLEGLRWLIREFGIAGIYLDGIGYDRQIMKRVRKVIDRTRPNCLIDFHSGNNYQPEYGMNNVCSGYMEILPFVDGLWLGEGFDYNESPEYWLIEVSGIPFGLTGEMLQGGGNPWRGLVFGMTNRPGWSDYDGTAEELWKLWDALEMDGCSFHGWWTLGCPVRTSHCDVRISVYVCPGRTMIAAASWAAEDVTVCLEINWKALGQDPAYSVLRRPAILRMQAARILAAGEPIRIEKNKGVILIAEDSRGV